MIEPIIRLCIKDYENTADKKVREKYSILGGLLGIICNLFLFASKFAVGMMSNSIAILSDAFNNLTDMGSSAISIISAKLSNRPPDKDHPFGHGRFEYLASLTIGMIILVVGYKLCETSIAKFFAPEPMEISYWSIGVLVLSIAVKGWMYCYNRYIGKKINSGVNEATAADSINDAIATTGVLVATIAQQFTSLPVDAAAGTLIGLMIIYAGYGIVREVVNILLGQAPDEQLVKQIVQMALQCDYVVGVHDIKIHDYGPGRKFASAHAEMAAETSPLDSHDALDNIEKAFRDEDGMIVTLHYDPIVTDDPKVASMRLRINAMAQQIDGRLSIHDLRCVPGPTHTNVIFDCVRPSDLAMSAEDLKRALAKRVESEYPKSIAKITIDEDYVGHTHE